MTGWFDNRSAAMNEASIEAEARRMDVGLIAVWIEGVQEPLGVDLYSIKNPDHSPWSGFQG